MVGSIALNLEFSPIPQPFRPYSNNFALKQAKMALKLRNPENIYLKKKTGQLEKSKKKKLTVFLRDCLQKPLELRHFDFTYCLLR
ncbi:hypothetical protein AC622_01780 [Bacillus sp. FJAT-27916]|nr:hypothetical protein AC622_01780 [Bacillus sp. FJAT-27916]